MKKPVPIPLTDNPRTKQIILLPLESQDTLDIKQSDEDHQQNNSKSIQQLESESSD